MRRIKSRIDLRTQGFTATALVMAALAVTCVTLAKGQGAAESARMNFSRPDAINTALVKSAPLVDAMDENILGGVYGGLDKCTSAATTSGRTITGVQRQRTAAALPPRRDDAAAGSR